MAEVSSRVRGTQRCGFGIWRAARRSAHSHGHTDSLTAAYGYELSSFVIVSQKIPETRKLTGEAPFRMSNAGAINEPREKKSNPGVTTSRYRQKRDLAISLKTLQVRMSSRSGTIPKPSNTSWMPSLGPDPFWRKDEKINGRFHFLFSKAFSNASTAAICVWTRCSKGKLIGVSVV
jgi:hypothetical protein